VKLLLFDIDGTLLDTRGAGLRALREAFVEGYLGPERAHEFPELDLAGSTDQGIVRELFARFHIPHTAAAEEFLFGEYVQRLRHGLDATAGRGGRLLPGVRELLRYLRDETSHTLGLLTGNIARGAWVKMESSGLDGVFGFGAFGDDHHDRDELGPMALKRAEEHTGRRFSATDTLVIGDTPKDIRCARAFGATAVAVATGNCSRDQLAAHLPDHLLDDLRDVVQFRALL
jgi:phosphoglycolate phosphatase-like HAD superfamily hydrolase